MKKFCMGILLCFSLAFNLQAQHSLNVTFDSSNLTQYNPEDVWVIFQNPNLGTTDFDISYKTSGVDTQVSFASSGNIMSNPIQLSTIDSGMMTVNKAISVASFIYYGSKPTAASGVPSYIGGGTDYNSIFQPFEITQNNGSGDQGNLTNINYYSIPLTVTSYHGAVSPGNILQQTGYTPASLPSLGNSIAALTASNPSAVIPSSPGTNTPTARIIGPSSFGAQPNPYPSFATYLGAVHDAGQSTTLQRANAFNKNGDPTQGNYNFQINMTAVVNADNSISITGHISTTVTPYGGTSSAGPDFADTNITFSGTIEQLNEAIYGQSDATGVTYTGAGWTAFQNYVNANSLGTAVSTTQAMAIGEITTGLLGGYVNSDYVPATVNGLPNTLAIKDLPSGTWWNLDPIVGFDEIQSNSAYYNQYSQLIFDASNNTVYSVPYSDRFGTGPLVNTVEYNSQSVDNWVIDLYDPVSVPEPSTYLLMGFGGIFLWFALRRKPVRQPSSKVVIP